MMVAFDGGNGVGSVLGDLRDGESGPAGEEFVSDSVSPCGDGWREHGSVIERNTISD